MSATRGWGSSPRVLLCSTSVLQCGLAYPGMKEGCSGENVLGRER